LPAEKGPARLFSQQQFTLLAWLRPASRAGLLAEKGPARLFSQQQSTYWFDEATPGI
jgi:hypothetical protein